MISDELFMLRAFELAQLGIGAVSPNPRVGCVIVYRDLIIGEGWHQSYGGPHAEVNAIMAVADKTLLSESTVYVNLEPCSHHGKTPPCADLLILHSVKKVVISNVDPNPLVMGSGIKKLRDAGIEVVTRILEEAGRVLNKRFFTFIEKQRPYLILKWAQTADGFLCGTNSGSKWISNEMSRKLVHRWRAEEDAILVGTNTAMNDNPSLTVRNWSGRNPLRIVIDRFLKLPADRNLWNNEAATICYNTIKNEDLGSVTFVCLDEKEFLPQLIRDLYNRKIQSVIIEGGAKTLRLFMDSGYWDEARIFNSPASIAEGIAAPGLRGNLVSVEPILLDELKIYQNGAHSNQ